MIGPNTMTLERLPAEMIDHIVSFLPPSSLAKLSQTSKLLRSHAEKELHWARLVKDNAPNLSNRISPYPLKRWKHLYLSQLPYWFIPRHKIWFSDRAFGNNVMTGLIMIARYDPRRACIEGCRLVVELGPPDTAVWELDPGVVINVFNPRVRLWREDPIVKIDSLPRRSVRFHKNMFQEVSMQTAPQGIVSTISLCEAASESTKDSQVALWPPTILPATQRIHNDSESVIHGGIRPFPRKPSDYGFRIRRGLMFGIREVMTFGTLPEDSYTPTKKKPWQGIWVGDYAGHGSEFLVILQKDLNSENRGIAASNEPSPSPPIAAVPARSSNTGVSERISGRTLSSPTQHNNDKTDIISSKVNSKENSKEPEDGSCYGRLEAIKLTGDHNVPLMEYTWIADDIGPKGLIRVAHEQIFKGARVVRSRGHVAQRDFQDGQ